MPLNADKPSYETVMFVSKSPCSSTSNPPTRTDGQPGCMERLLLLIGQGLQNHRGQIVHFRLTLGATKPYQPAIRGGKNASKSNYRDFGGGPGGDSGSAFGFVRS